MVDYVLSGAVEVRRGGRSVPLGGVKQRCVLAVLLANHGSVVSTDQLIQHVWEDDAPPKALASLRAYVSNLRRVLGDDDRDVADADPVRLETRPRGYRLNLFHGDSVDLHRFESLVCAARTALDDGDAGGAVGMLGESLVLWRGDPFGDFAYSEFAAPEVQRFAGLRSAATELRLRAALQLGGGAELIPEIRAALAQNPLHEPLWAHLMLALHRAGRTSDAVRAFDRACEVLKREVGGQPGADLQATFDQITTGTTELDGQLAARIRPAPSALLGRDRELSLATETVSRVRDGVGGMVLVAGESGIGKTSFARAVTKTARAAGIAVAWAGHPSGINLPQNWAWIQVLRQLGNEFGDDGRGAIKRAAAGVVDALVPEWNSATPAVGASVPAAGFALAEGIVLALEALSALRPVLVVIDDAQGADAATLDALVVLAAQLPRLRLQVMVNWRYHGVARPVNRAALERLAGRTDSVTIHLGGIDAQATGELINLVTGTAAAPEVADYVSQYARGNPFYIKEIARTLDAGSTAVPSLPETVVDVLRRRLDELGRPCRQILAAAAVLGPGFDLAEVAAMVNLSTSTVETRLRPALADGVVDETADLPGTYRFSHGLTRDAVLATLSSEHQAELHAAAASARASGLESDPYEIVIAAADHAWQAGTHINPVSAVDVHETTIQRALHRSAYADVATLTERALHLCRRLPAKPELLERQAALWLHLAGARGILDGQGSASATEAVQRAFEIGAHIKGRSFYGAVAVQASMLCAHGRIDEADVIAQGLREQYGNSGDVDCGVASDFATVVVAGLRGETDLQIEVGLHMMNTFPAPETVTDPMHFFHPRVYTWMSLGEALRGNADASRRYGTRALQLASSRGDVFNVLGAKLTLVEAAAIMGELRGTAAAAAAVEQEFAAAGGQQWGAAARIVNVWAEAMEGRVVDSQEGFDAFDTLRSDGTCVMHAYFLALLSDIELRVGRRDAAAALIERARNLVAMTGEHVWDEFLDRRTAAIAAAEPGIAGSPSNNVG
ncbi:AfsR/SARP family transcriptional regulator [Mycolicibacterium llatzerense]|uniref:AfsR/SARP family transcriptional regulator n=1 Tax=Mycolicibacterium llatzerense TaxID=280871 RepID=UPI0021B66096|nr:AfsR/SARP family transcriptional regulator [Mycolicibacterium llatzerense]MCT7370438.1 transcriptional regulator [Mycolicibacterium llatzerense]